MKIKFNVDTLSMESINAAKSLIGKLMGDINHQEIDKIIDEKNNEFDSIPPSQVDEIIDELYRNVAMLSDKRLNDSRVQLLLKDHRHDIRNAVKQIAAEVKAGYIKYIGECYLNGGSYHLIWVDKGNCIRTTSFSKEWGPQLIDAISKELTSLEIIGVMRSDITKASYSSGRFILPRDLKKSKEIDE